MKLLDDAKWEQEHKVTEEEAEQLTMDFCDVDSISSDLISVPFFPSFEDNSFYDPTGEFSGTAMSRIIHWQGTHLFHDFWALAGQMG